MTVPVSPRWRWWLFCAANALSVRTRWRWAFALETWCILPSWMGDAEDMRSDVPGVEAPF